MISDHKRAQVCKETFAGWLAQNAPWLTYEQWIQAKRCKLRLDMLTINEWNRPYYVQAATDDLAKLVSMIDV